jgi:hypothetical protein
MNHRPLRLPLVAAAFAALAALTLIACFRDDGFVSPGDPSKLPLLAAYSGRVTESKAFENGRALGLVNPKIALVWQFVGPSSFGVAFDGLTINAKPPYRFSVELRNPPPPAIANSEEPVIGAFWLYNDWDDDGKLGRITHPEVAKHDSELAALQEQCRTTLQALLSVAFETPTYVPYKDSFLLDSTGTFIHWVGGKLDTIYASKGPKDASTWNDVIFRRTRILKHFNGWQNFFALRKKSHDYYRTATPLSDHSYLQVFQDWRKIFPQRGKEEEFELRLETATMASIAFFARYSAVQTEAYVKGWINYPYDGFKDEGQDWVAGKSLRNFVLYFPTETAMDRVLEAERTGSFRVDNIDALHLGYNLLYCDDQYRCRVMAKQDSISMELAQDEAYFNPPSAPLDFPVKSYQAVAVPVDTLKKMEGGYSFQAFRPITVLSRKGALWCDIPDLGLHRLEPAGQTLYFIPGTDIQIEFVSGQGGAISKLLLYHLGSRAVAIRADSAMQTATVEGRIEAIVSHPRASLREPLPEKLPTAYAYGMDTLALSISPAGDTIRASRTKTPDLAFLPANDSEAYSASSEEGLAFSRNEKGEVMGLRLIRPGENLFLPNLGYAPRKPIPVEFLPDSGFGPAYAASASGGTGKDSYVNWGAKHRYGCAQDGFYLKSGDGWVQEVRKGETGDSISLRDPGDGLVFKITGQAGKRLKLELIACAEKGGKQGRVLMDLRGGSDANGPWNDRVSETDWVKPGLTGDTLIFQPIPIPSDPYFLDLSQVHTVDDSLYYSFDGYRAWTR